VDHEPDPQFAEHLEWQIRTELRRSDRFARPAHPPYLRRLGVAALALLSLSAGAGGVMAAEHMQAAQERAAAQRQRELLLLRAGVLEEMSASRVEIAGRQLARIEQMHASGVASDETVASARVDCEQAQREQRRRQLDREEIEAGGVEPSDDLLAPLVDGRDFVAERLELEIEGVRRVLAAVVERHTRVARLFEAGLGSSQEVTEAELEVARADAEIRVLARRLDVRLAWARGEVQGERVLLLAMQAESEARLDAQRQHAALAARRLAQQRQMVEAGLAAPDPGLEAQVVAAEGEVRLLEIELELLANRLSAQQGSGAPEGEGRGR